MDVGGVMDEKRVAQWIIDTVELFGGDALTALRVAEVFVTGVRAELARQEPERAKKAGDS